MRRIIIVLLTMIIFSGRSGADGWPCWDVGEKCIFGGTCKPTTGVWTCYCPDGDATTGRLIRQTGCDNSHHCACSYAGTYLVKSSTVSQQCTYSGDNLECQ